VTRNRLSSSYFLLRVVVYIARKLNSVCYYCSLVQTCPEKFENTALFQRLDLPSTLAGSVTKAELFGLSSNRTNLKTPIFVFVSKKVFCDGAFWKRYPHDKHVIFLPESFLKYEFKMTGDCFAFKFIRGSVNVFRAGNFRFQIRPA